MHLIISNAQTRPQQQDQIYTMHQLSYLALALLSTQFHHHLLAEARPTSFTINLIHRFSPQSPFFNHSLTPSQFLTKSAQLSLKRANYFLSLTDTKTIQSPLSPFSGAYIMKISIGSPPSEFFAVADTGSDLVWVQCAPCQVCYGQTTPLFEPQKSSTYSGVPCNSDTCLAGPDTHCSRSNACVYQVLYGGEPPSSTTVGVLSSDTFSFDSTDNNGPVLFPGSIFGCGYDNEGKFPRGGPSAGIVGLGRGPLSLISQLGPEIGYKFSYCLVPHSSQSSSSKMNFGGNAILSGPGVVSTPLVAMSDPTFYYVTLNSISIGDRRTQIMQTEGNIIIDSGTTLTLLQPGLYENLKAIVKGGVGLQPVTEQSGDFDLCYGAEAASGAISAMPDMVFHFAGADLYLKTVNTFELIDDLICMTIVPNDQLSILGNYAQINFQVGFDLQSKQVYFAPADCTKQ